MVMRVGDEHRAVRVGDLDRDEFDGFVGALRDDVEFGDCGLGR